jgi:hypothetical protein
VTPDSALLLSCAMPPMRLRKSGAGSSARISRAADSCDCRRSAGSPNSNVPRAAKRQPQTPRSDPVRSSLFARFVGPHSDRSNAYEVILYNLHVSVSLSRKLEPKGKRGSLIL